MVTHQLRTAAIGAGLLVGLALFADSPSGGIGLSFQENGTPIGFASTLNCTHNITCTTTGPVLTLAGPTVPFDPVYMLSGYLGSPNSATPLTANQVIYTVAPTNCTVQSVSILIFPADTATVKVWKVASGTALPTSGNSISTSGISISTGTALNTATLTDFTSTFVGANNILGFTDTAVGGTATYLWYGLQCE